MKTKLTGFKTGIVCILLMLIYLFLAKSTDDNRLRLLIMFAAAVSFLFFGYWRLYWFYKLEKLRKLHDGKNFADYFDNMDFATGCKHFVLPLPIWKRLATDEENKMRAVINISTVMLYISFVLFIYLVDDLRK